MPFDTEITDKYLHLLYNMWIYKFDFCLPTPDKLSCLEGLYSGQSMTCFKIFKEKIAARWNIREDPSGVKHSQQIN